jgi:hypothetical protein
VVDSPGKRSYRRGANPGSRVRRQIQPGGCYVSLTDCPRCGREALLSTKPEPRDLHAYTGRCLHCGAEFTFHPVAPEMPSSARSGNDRFHIRSDCGWIRRDWAPKYQCSGSSDCVATVQADSLIAELFGRRLDPGTSSLRNTAARSVSEIRSSSSHCNRIPLRHPICTIRRVASWSEESERVRCCALARSKS